MEPCVEQMSSWSVGAWGDIQGMDGFAFEAAVHGHDPIGFSRSRRLKSSKSRELPWRREVVCLAAC